MFGHKWLYAYASIQNGWLEHSWYCTCCHRRECTAEYNDAVVRRIMEECDNRIPRPGKCGWDKAR